MSRRAKTPGAGGRNPEGAAHVPAPGPQRVLPARAVVIGSVVVGGAILGGSWMLKSSLDGTVARLDAIGTSLAETTQALERAAEAREDRPAQQKRRGPDPDKRYAINTKGAPRKGSAAARVQLVEFSDFQ